MQNDYSNKQGQSAADKASEFARSAGQQVEDAQKKFKEVQEQAGKALCSVDKQVRENPWPVIAGVAIGAFLLGSLTSRK